MQMSTILYVRTCLDAEVFQSKVVSETEMEERIYSKNATHGQTYPYAFHGLVQPSFQVPSQEPSLNYCVRVALLVAVLPCSS